MSAPVCPATPERAVLLHMVETTMRRIDAALDRRDKAEFIRWAQTHAGLKRRLVAK